MALTPEQLDDLVALTLSNSKKKVWTDISLELQDYVAAKLNSDKYVTEKGGPDLRFKVKVRNTDTAINSGMYGVDNPKVEDLMETAVIPWTKQVGSFSYDVDEPFFQDSDLVIVDELKVREHSALSNLAELAEENLWNEPTSSSDKRPMGIPFWIQKDATTTPGGAFNGGNPTGFSGGCAGLSSTTYPRWRNWTFGYTAVTRDDLIDKVKKAIRYTRFIAPVPHPVTGFGGAQCEMFTVYDVQNECERLAEDRNDNLKNDLAKYLDAVLIAGVPMHWVPYLTNNDSSKPIYGVNFGKFRPVVKRGANMRRSKPKQAPFQSSVRNVFYDTWMNYGCYDRRSLFVGSVA